MSLWIGSIGEVDTVKRKLKTHAGHTITFKETKFIEYLIAGKTEVEAYHMAGYSGANPSRQVKNIIGKKYVYDELQYRLQQAKEASIADRVEILQYYSDVMRGEIKDQFGLDAPLAERTKAANELAKRVIDYERELAQSKNASQEINVTLNWAREENGDGNNSENTES